MIGKLYFTIGSCRSGKSTYSKKWIKELSNCNRVIVNSDNVRLALYGSRYLRLPEPYVHAITETMVRAHLLAGCEVLCDETNTTISSIRKWLSIDPDSEAIFIDTSKEICIERAYSSGHTDLAEKGVIDRHFKNLIDLSYYGFKISEEKAGRKGSYTYFDKPSKVYIYEAIEYIRKEVKNGLSGN